MMLISTGEVETGRSLEPRDQPAWLDRRASVVETPFQKTQWSWAVVAHTFNPSIQGRGRWVSEFEVSLT